MLLANVQENRYDAIYSRMPNFESYNNLLGLNGTSLLLLGPLAGLLLSTDNIQSLAGRVSLYSTIGIAAAKASLMLGAYAQGKIRENTSAYVQEQIHLSQWGVLVPPSNPAITDCQIRCEQLKVNLRNSFPTSIEIKQAIEASVDSRALNTVPNVPMPQPKPYTSEQLENECEQLMNGALEIAEEVRKDLQTWSANGRIQLNGQPLTGSALLIAQPGTWGLRGKPYSCPWLYRGFFHLPEAYDRIFNLTNCTPESKRIAPYWKKFVAAFFENYPASNRTILEGWKEKFFEPGTKQYEWRQQYNRAMQNIYDITGENIPDERFTKNGRQHEDGDYDFSALPTSRPT